MHSKVGAFFLATCLVFATCIRVVAQTESDCPENIGFELGDFSNWKCYTGGIDPKTNVINISQLGEVEGRHTIIPATSTELDFYGNFPVVCPNGSNYSVMLGNATSGSQAEKMTYRFKVPDDAADYTFIYNYAVVFQNPSHAVEAQPKFTVNVFDDVTNQSIGCGSHDFVATSNLPGFQRAGTSDKWFKPWAPVSINFLGYAGKTIRIEFATNDCAPGGHFGYAYVDVNENCSSPISGNTVCPGITDHVTLKAPAGFKEYYWYNSDMSQVLGKESTLTISPIPPLNTIYALKIVPFPELGCENVLYTSITEYTGPLDLKVTPEPLAGCRDVGVDLTAPFITAGSTPKFKFSYYTDQECTTFVQGAKAVKQSGTYYIKATNPSGCFVVKPVNVQIFDPPKVVVNNPGAICKPGAVNLTNPAITSGSGPGIVFSYWKDVDASIPLTSPAAVSESGVYYIKATLPNTCPVMTPVTVSIVDIPVLKIAKAQFEVCAGEYLTEAEITQGSSTGLVYTFFRDAALTQKLSSLQEITISSTYYVKATNYAGCLLTAPFKVICQPELDLRVAPITTVDYPETVDLNTTITPVNGLTYTFWLDALATKPVENPSKILASGKFFVKAENSNHCRRILPMEVVVVPPPLPSLKSTNAFTPNGDGTNDTFRMELTGIIDLNYFKVFDRWGQVVFSGRSSSQAWDGKKDGIDVPTGTYYWVFDGYDRYYKQKVNSSGSVILIR